jgi:hypothetical protein
LVEVGEVEDVEADDERRRELLEGEVEAMEELGGVEESCKWVQTALVFMYERQLQLLGGAGMDTEEEDGEVRACCK